MALTLVTQRIKQRIARKRISRMAVHLLGVILQMNKIKLQRRIWRKVNNKMNLKMNSASSMRFCKT